MVKLSTVVAQFVVVRAEDGQSLLQTANLKKISKVVGTTTTATPAPQMLSYVEEDGSTEAVGLYSNGMCGMESRRTTPFYILWPEEEDKWKTVASAAACQQWCKEVEDDPDHGRCTHWTIYPSGKCHLANHGMKQTWEKHSSGTKQTDFGIATTFTATRDCVLYPTADAPEPPPFFAESWRGKYDAFHYPPEEDGCVSQGHRTVPQSHHLWVDIAAVFDAHEEDADNYDLTNELVSTIVSRDPKKRERDYRTAPGEFNECRKRCQLHAAWAASEGVTPCAYWTHYKSGWCQFSEHINPEDKSFYTRRAKSNNDETRTGPVDCPGSQAPCYDSEMTGPSFPVRSADDLCGEDSCPCTD